MTLEHLPLIMLRAFALTVLVECAAAWCLGVRDCYSQMIVILANLMTNPLVVSGGAVVIVQIGYGALLPAMLVVQSELHFTHIIAGSEKNALLIRKRLTRIWDRPFLPGISRMY